MNVENKSICNASCNASVCDESINISGHCFCKSDVEKLLLESFKFRRIFLEYHKISLDELNKILGVNKLYEDKLKAFEDDLRPKTSTPKTLYKSSSVQHATI